MARQVERKSDEVPLALPGPLENRRMNRSWTSLASLESLPKLRRQLAAPGRDALLVDSELQDLVFHQDASGDDRGVDRRLRNAEDEMTQGRAGVERRRRIIVDQDHVGGRPLADPAQGEPPDALGDGRIAAEKRPGRFHETLGGIAPP